MQKNLYSTSFLLSFLGVVGGATLALPRSQAHPFEGQPINRNRRARRRDRSRPQTKGAHDWSGQNWRNY